MSVEFMGSADPTPSNPESGPSTGSWAQHHSGDAEGAFPDMDVDADLERISCVESLCMNCHQQGMTRLLLTRIPYFREIVVMSFACPHCYARSAEVQPANDLSEKACKVTLRVAGGAAGDFAATKADLNRQVIKSETGRVEIPELEFEIPPNEKRGDINTVEGVLTNIADSLAADQPNRELSDPETAEKIERVIEKFRAYAKGEEAFTFILDDLAGNSFLENPSAPSKDPRVSIEYYPRTREQTLELGYAVEENKSEMEAREVIKGEEAARKMKELFPNGAPAASSSSSSASSGQKAASAAHAATQAQRGIQVAPEAMATIDTYFNVSDRSAIMTGPCNGCDNQEAETRMCVTDVPHFKDVVLLVTQCDQCGYRDAEVKPMGRVSEKGRRITLKVTSVDDLKRDLLKSDTASCTIPELDLELESGTLGGKYTTLEGLIEDIVGQLSRVNPFSMGDSSQPEQKGKMSAFMSKLEALPLVEQPWTFILDCPLGNCFIYSPLGDADPHLTVSRYTRTFDQDEELGLNDMNVDDYLTEAQKEEMRKEMQQEEQEKEIEKAMAEELSLRSGGDPAAASSSSSPPVVSPAERMAELKQSKIGGHISVEHEMDMEGATGNEQKKQ
jgi:zinc finger protein